MDCSPSFLASILATLVIVIDVISLRGKNIAPSGDVGTGQGSLRVHIYFIERHKIICLHHLLDCSVK
jgi:hypothetical protein